MEQNPKTERRKWRYTWEAQSHSPNLRLFLFDSETNPKNHCKSLNVSTLLEKSQLLVTWIGSEAEGSEDDVSLLVPVPRVLLDAESAVKFRALDDHIEVRLALLLPVDHPLVSGLVNEDRVKSAPLVMDCDVKALALMGGVHLHCRKCSVRLTKRALFEFSEMPSVNWRESADNWFGTCCCSFGGISEKMVVKYTDSYACSSGLCLLSATTVLLSEDDLIECVLSDKIGMGRGCDLGGVELGSGRGEVDTDSYENGGEVDDSIDKASSVPECCGHDSKDKASSIPECCGHDSFGSSESFQLDQRLTLDKKFLLDGFLEDVFMAKASNVSKNVEWVELACPECSSPLGAYPSGSGSNGKPIDGGVRLYKCYISTSSAKGESSDVFRKYTLERMFTNQLVECAKEELSFHVLVKDLTTKSPLFQIIILNPNSWSLTGLCSSEEEAGFTLELSPIVKVLFSDCKSSPVKKVDEEVYISKGQGEELMELLTNASKFLPSSCAYLQGSIVSSMHY
ncbi:hypothetical protein HA466_0306600 [Hirschfeldia incana]|nr:hypothetical protein HA466_0306600 [Hirschfeldia incana]